MRFRFNERKAAQAGAYLLQKQGGTWTYGSLLKLLYLADRRKLLESGHPITGDALAALPHGPVPSGIYNIICDASADDTRRPWYEYITPPRGEWQVSVTKRNPETDELSRYELRLLDDVHEQYGHMTFSELRAATHELPEWTDPFGSSRPITPESIFRAESRSQEDIDRANTEAEETWFVGVLADRR